MSAIYLPIRSFGDFIITASVIKEHADTHIPAIIPHYLDDIFTAIEAGKYFKVLKHIDFNNQPAFFEVYKVKDRQNLARLLRDMAEIYRVFNRGNTYLLDYSSKRILYTGAKLKWPSTTQNIYRAKYDLFASYFNLKPYKDEIGVRAFNKQDASVLILPDSRIKDKEIDAGLVDTIASHFKNNPVQVARFSKDNAQSGDVLTYSSFTQLLQLMAKYSLIISAESLPYHLANYINKPHFVVYNNSRHFKSTFMTPFMQTNGFYSFSEQNNHTNVISKLEEILL